MDVEGVDIHVYVDSAFRRLGLMKRALLEAVVPHLRQTGCRIRRATFSVEENPPASNALLEGCGFHVTPGQPAALDLDSVGEFDYPSAGVVGAYRRSGEKELVGDSWRSIYDCRRSVKNLKWRVFMDWKMPLKER